MWRAGSARLGRLAAGSPRVYPCPVPDPIRHFKDAGHHTAEADISYLIARETLLPTGKSALSRWRKLLFGFPSRNPRPATSFFGIPPNRVVEMGAQIEL